MHGVVAAGHPLTAEAGAGVLREGGNAVDAAVAAVLASFAVESPLTGFGAGGYMMVHAGGETTLIDFFVAAPGLDGVRRRAELVAGPGPLRRRDRADVLRRPRLLWGPGHRRRTGPGAGTVRLGAARRRWSAPGVRLAREGAPVNAEQAYILEILEPIHAASGRDAGALRAPGRQAAAGGGDLPLRRSWPRRWNASAPKGRSRSTAASWRRP